MKPNSAGARRWDTTPGHLIAVLAVLLVCGGTAEGQVSDPLLRRWVGTHQGRPLHLEFYGDTMLIVNDIVVLDYHVTRDSIIAVGDTTFAVHYSFALGWLLLGTAEGNVITMSEQTPLARPLSGRWLGSPSRQGGQQIELRLRRGGTARWRWVIEESWTEGEWDRLSRIITFTWLPDSTQWIGHYDPPGNALLFQETVPESGPAILRRVFRR